jgi:hypothetical protein
VTAVDVGGNVVGCDQVMLTAVKSSFLKDDNIVGQEGAPLGGKITLFSGQLEALPQLLDGVTVTL